MIAGFRREAHENYALLGYYAASRGNILQRFRDKDGTDRFSRNVGNKLPPFTA